MQIRPANLWADVRLALRSWRKSPAFAAIAIASIGLGIGANAAIFTLVDQVLLRTLPVKNSHELIQVTFTGSRYGNNWGDGSEPERDLAPPRGGASPIARAGSARGLPGAERVLPQRPP